jgi:hypothetical protein
MEYNFAIIFDIIKTVGICTTWHYAKKCGTKLILPSAMPTTSTTRTLPLARFQPIVSHYHRPPRHSTPI